MVVYNGSMTTSGLYQKKIQMISEGFQEINPEKILLFGSASSGNINKDSDIDIFVLGDISNFDKIKYELKLNKNIELHTFQNRKEIDEIKTGLIKNIINGYVIKGQIQDIVEVE